MATKLSKFDHESLCRVSSARGFLGFKKDITSIIFIQQWKEAYKRVNGFIPKDLIVLAKIAKQRINQLRR